MIKMPKILFGIPIVIAIAVTLSIILDGIDTETFTAPKLENVKPSDVSSSEVNSLYKLYSGPFAILKDSYSVDDTVFLIGSEIPLDSKGEMAFIRPDGEIHHKFPWDGSKSAVNHYFTPVSSNDLEECSGCGFFGTWEIVFTSEQGISYSPIHFEIIDSEN